MGEISGKTADYTIITSDNPRTENPEEIVKVDLRKSKLNDVTVKFRYNMIKLHPITIRPNPSKKKKTLIIIFLI